MSTPKIPITVAHGDGIGPEIMEATLHIIEEAGAELEIETIEAGEKAHAGGHSSGIDAAGWDSLSRTRVFLKAPATTPADPASQSLSVTIRKAFGLYANVRPSISFHPYIETKHPQMDVVIVRENEEDVFAGIEYRQSTDLARADKIISRPGSERIIRYAFEYAQAQGRKKVTCFTKSNILKMTDGLFHRTFDDIGVHYPEIEKEHGTVDIGAARLADRPEDFDVLVLPNLYGDILSDLAAQIAGSIGLAGAANIGATAAMFEAVHGSSPRRAGQNLANPSGLFLGAVMMLVHIGQTEAATRAHNAWLKTIEDGIHTYDIFTEGISKQKVGTKEFAKAVVERLGQAPSKLKPVSYKNAPPATSTAFEYHRPTETKQLVGVDVYVEFTKGSPEELARILQPAEVDGLKLERIANRGASVWPRTHAETLLTDSFACRFRLPDPTKGPLAQGSVIALLEKIAKSGIEFLKMELLYTFDGQPGFTQSQE
jgi:isocitrate dehydrogenase